MGDVFPGKQPLEVLGSPSDLELRLPRNSPFVGSLRHAPQGEVGAAMAVAGGGGFLDVGNWEMN